MRISELLSVRCLSLCRIRLRRSFPVLNKGCLVMTGMFICAQLYAGVGEAILYGSQNGFRGAGSAVGGAALGALIEAIARGIDSSDREKEERARREAAEREERERQEEEKRKHNEWLRDQHEKQSAAFGLYPDLARFDEFEDKLKELKNATLTSFTRQQKISDLQNGGLSKGRMVIPVRVDDVESDGTISGTVERYFERQDLHVSITVRTSEREKLGGLSQGMKIVCELTVQSPGTSGLGNVLRCKDAILDLTGKRAKERLRILERARMIANRIRPTGLGNSAWNEYLEYLKNYAKNSVEENEEQWSVLKTRQIEHVVQVKSPCQGSTIQTVEACVDGLDLTLRIASSEEDKLWALVPDAVIRVRGFPTGENGFEETSLRDVAFEIDEATSLEKSSAFAEVWFKHRSILIPALGEFIACTNGLVVGRTEVTQAAWEHFMGTAPSRDTGEGLPVENVSWEDCNNFIEKVNASDEAVRENLRFRMLSVDEWRTACLAGSSGDWGRLLSQRTYDERWSFSWSKRDRREHSLPVASKKCNAWGLYDMHGNLWEWCSDDKDGRKACCGGSWANEEDCCSAKSVQWVKPTVKVPNLGLRLCAEKRN